MSVFFLGSWEIDRSAEQTLRMGVGTGGGGHRGHVPPPPPIILPSEIFLTQYALLSMKLVHKMLIFNKIFRLASLANQDNIKIYKIKRSNYFTSLIPKVPVLVQNIQKVWNHLFNTQSPLISFQNYYTPRNEVRGGYTGITLSVRLSVCPSVDARAVR